MKKNSCGTPDSWNCLLYTSMYKYNSKCDLDNPKTFSEKLLWLWLHSYRKNIQILKLSDKYDVRRYIINSKLGECLNELYFVTDDWKSIRYEELPNSFALKLSQGCNTNLICIDRNKLTPAELKSILYKWSKGQFWYCLLYTSRCV